ncbi:hypothetical protein HTG_04925 [Natrinema mahii]|nr:hypothetical protein HTG_04925 [Natrinema mahii]
MLGTEPPYQSTTDRGQAYTLEGFIGAMIVLMAVLFALQSAAVAPSTGGDRAVQPYIQQETQDALVVAATADDENLSYMVRHWHDDGFEDADNDDVTYDESTFSDEFVLGSILERRFGEGRSYNVELHSQTNETYDLVDQGTPPSGAVTASYTVTIYDDQNVTGDLQSDQTVSNVSGPIADVADGNDETLYNVVEVRVIAW